jgi:hypothetical protein
MGPWTTYSGVVASYDRQHGEGWVRWQPGQVLGAPAQPGSLTPSWVKGPAQPDIYLHHSALICGSQPHAGDSITFLVEPQLGAPGSLQVATAIVDAAPTQQPAPTQQHDFVIKGFGPVRGGSEWLDRVATRIRQHGLGLEPRPRTTTGRPSFWEAGEIYDTEMRNQKQAELEVDSQDAHAQWVRASRSRSRSSPTPSRSPVRARPKWRAGRLIPIEVQPNIEVQPSIEVQHAYTSMLHVK